MRQGGRWRSVIAFILIFVCFVQNGSFVLGARLTGAALVAEGTAADDKVAASSEGKAEEKEENSPASEMPSQDLESAQPSSGEFGSQAVQEEETEFAEDQKQAEVPESKTAEAGKNMLFDQSLEALVYRDKSYSEKIRDSEIYITLEGKLPEGASVKAYPVELQDFAAVAAYDITIFDKEGNVFQPEDSSILVTFAGKALEKLPKVNIFHMKDEEAEPEKIEEELSVSEGAVSFEAESFSIYVIEDPNKPTFYRTYYFHDEDGRIMEEATEKLSEGEAVKKPAPPTKESAVFDGWKTKDGHAFEDWGTLGSLQQDEEVHIYASFRKVYYVYYKAEDRQPTEFNPVMVFYTQTYEVGKDQKLDYTDIPFPLEEGYALVGWSQEPGGVDPVENLETIVNEDMRLFPIIKKAYWITYESNKGSYEKPAYVLEGNITVEPNRPTRTGYVFDGWYTDPLYQKPFTFGKELTRNITLYAKWKTATTGYGIIYWKQKTTDTVATAEEDKSYEYAGSVRRYGNTGEMVTISNEDKLLASTNPAFDHFHFNTNRVERETLAADGSTVLNVYYDRDVMYIAFNSAIPAANYNVPGLRDSYSYYRQNEFVLKGLYGQSFVEAGVEWPSPGSGAKWMYYPINTNLKRGMTFKDSFDDVDSNLPAKNRYVIDPDTGREIQVYRSLSVYYRETSASYGLLRHYTENLDGSWSRSIEMRATATNFSISEKYKGFTPSYIRRIYRTYAGTYYEGSGQNTDIGSSYQISEQEGLAVYHARRVYNLLYATAIDGKEIESYTEKLKYQQPITAAFEKGEPAKPKDIQGNPFYPNYYKFAGWFYDPQGVRPVVFDGTATMPNGDLKIYAVWKAPEVRVTFDPDNGTTIPSQTFLAGNKMDKPPEPKKDNFEFAGWVTQNGSPFNLNADVVENVDLVARWISRVGYRTHYYSNYPAGSVPAGTAEGRHDGPKVYAPGSSAKVVAISPDWGWESPQGKIGFLSWNTKPDGSGKTYLPGDNILLNSPDVRLYAIWSKPLAAHITYDLNFDVPSDLGQRLITKYYADNSKAIIGDGELANITKDNLVRPGYRFTGWKHWTGSKYELLQNGQEVEVNTRNDEKENILIAQWTKIVDVDAEINVSGEKADREKIFIITYIIEGEGKKTEVGSLKISHSMGIVKNDVLQNLTQGSKVRFLLGDYKARVEDGQLVLADRPEENYEEEGYKLRRITDKTDGPLGQGDLDRGSWSYMIGEASENHLVGFNLERAAVEVKARPVISGNMADHDKVFTFTYTWELGDRKEFGTFTTSEKAGYYSNDKLAEIPAGAKLEIRLGDYNPRLEGGKILLDNRPAIDYQAQGYFLSEIEDIADGEEVGDVVAIPAKGSWTFAVDKESVDHALTFRLVRSAVAPTKLDFDTGVWLLVGAVTVFGAFCMILWKRRRKDLEEYL